MCIRDRTYGTDKSNTNTRKLRNAERAKYEIHHAVYDALEVADSWQKLSLIHISSIIVWKRKLSGKAASCLRTLFLNMP